MEALLGFAFIAYMAAFCLKIITVWDADNGLYFHKGMAAAMVLYGIAAALYISKEQEPARGILLGVYFSYLITAAYEDYCTRLVHRFLHYLAAAAGLLYLLLYGRGIGSGLAVVLFALLQIGFGRRYFGTADAAAFAVSGLFFADGQRPGRILLLGLFHMLLSIVLVLLIKHRQIDFKKGSIEPTAFMPYIAAAALMLRYWMKYAGGM